LCLTPRKDVLAFVTLGDIPITSVVSIEKMYFSLMRGTVTLMTLVSIVNVSFCVCNLVRQYITSLEKMSLHLRP
jgi:hypothetical protein